MRWIYRLLRLFKCPHKWKVILEKEQAYVVTHNNEERVKFIKHVYVLQCQHCKTLDFKEYSI